MYYIYKDLSTKQNYQSQSLYLINSSINSFNVHLDKQISSYAEQPPTNKYQTIPFIKRIFKTISNLQFNLSYFFIIQVQRKTFDYCLQYLNMRQQPKIANRALKRNTQIFALLMILIQIAACLIYGFLFTINVGLINIASIIVAVLLALLTIAGFGLVFSNLKRLIWSGLGFTFLITALSILLYPLINAFWTKTKLQYNPSAANFTSNTYSFLLANGNITQDKTYGNCITNAIKCALAIAVAFSSIVGRAGALECLLVTGIGAVGFELNRQVILNLAIDSFGTYFIFTYGGFMGLAMGFILRLKENKVEGHTTEKHELNTSSVFATTYSLFGTLIIFALFPVLAYDIDTFSPFNIFNLTNGPLSVIVGMGASVVGAYSVSSIINGTAIARDLIHAPIAGGIVVGAASVFVTNPVYSFVAGFTAGALQSIIQNTIEAPAMRKTSVLSTISWSLFGIQGIVGGVFATGYRKILDYNSNGFTYAASSINFNPGYELAMAAISAGIGLGFGIIVGLLILLTTGQTTSDHFIDRPHWINDDGISFPKAKPVPDFSRAPQGDESATGVIPGNVSEAQLGMSFSEGESVRNPFAFL